MEKCKSCAYYRSLAGGNDGNMACHFLLANGHTRSRTANECLSYMPETEENRRLVMSKMNQASRGGS